MWTTPSRLLPKAMTPVAAWDGIGLYVAMRAALKRERDLRKQLKK